MDRLKKLYDKQQNQNQNSYQGGYNSAGFNFGHWSITIFVYNNNKCK